MNSGHATIFNKSYAYSAAGDITQITDLRANSAYAYEYDALHRLTAETNLYGATATTASILSFEYTAGSVHGVDRITDEIYDTQYDLGYDGNGNQTSGVDLPNPAQPVDRTIHYNAGNMPTRIDMDGVQASAITYDGENARAVKASTGSATYYINPYFEIENGVETRYIFGNNTRIARIKGTDTLYFHKDHLGSTAVLTGSNGLEIAPPTAYLPYGMDRNGNGQAVSGYKFTDQEQEHETGLYNYDARLYDPVTALFVSPDPYFSANLAAHIYYSGLLEGNSNSAGFPVSYKADEFALYFSDPQRLNRYAYVLNNPVNLIDPLGLFTEVIVWQPVGWGQSSFGHISVNINDTSYSFSPSGMRSFDTDDYLSKNTFREGIGSELNLSSFEEKQLDEFLKNYDQSYFFPVVTCVTPIQQGLEKLGYDLGFNLYPVSLGYSLMNSGIVNKYDFYEATTPRQGSSAPWAK